MIDALIGKTVIHYSGDTRYIYEGEHDIPGVTGTRWNLRDNQELPAIRADLNSVAPASLVIPEKNDGRLEVVKRDPSELEHGKRGRAWQARIDDRWVSNFKTKRDAMATGLRRLAILDWHDQVDANTEAMMNAQGASIDELNDAAAFDRARGHVAGLMMEGLAFQS